MGKPVQAGCEDHDSPGGRAWTLPVCSRPTVHLCPSLLCAGTSEITRAVAMDMTTVPLLLTAWGGDLHQRLSDEGEATEAPSMTVPDVAPTDPGHAGPDDREDTLGQVPQP